MIIKLLVDGGAMSPGPAVGQQLGPLGINIGEVISKVNEATSGFKGTRTEQSSIVKEIIPLFPYNQSSEVPRVPPYLGIIYCLPLYR